MAKVKYYAKENSSIGTHRFYAVPIPNGTLTFDTLLSITVRSTHVHYLSVQTKRHWGLAKTTAVKVCMNISRQGYSQKEAESNYQELENYV